MDIPRRIVRLIKARGFFRNRRGSHPIIRERLEKYNYVNRLREYIRSEMDAGIFEILVLIILVVMIIVLTADLLSKIATRNPESPILVIFFTILALFYLAHFCLRLRVIRTPISLDELETYVNRLCSQVRCISESKYIPSDVLQRVRAELAQIQREINLVREKRRELERVKEELEVLERVGSLFFYENRGVILESSPDLSSLEICHNASVESLLSRTDRAGSALSIKN